MVWSPGGLKGRKSTVQPRVFPTSIIVGATSGSACKRCSVLDARCAVLSSLHVIMSSAKPKTQLALNPSRQSGPKNPQTPVSLPSPAPARVTGDEQPGQRAQQQSIPQPPLLLPLLLLLLLLTLACAKRMALGSASFVRPANLASPGWRKAAIFWGPPTLPLPRGAAATGGGAVGRMRGDAMQASRSGICAASACPVGRCPAGWEPVTGGYYVGGYGVHVCLRAWVAYSRSIHADRLARRTPSSSPPTLASPPQSPNLSPEPPGHREHPIPSVTKHTRKRAQKPQRRPPTSSANPPFRPESRRPRPAPHLCTHPPANLVSRHPHAPAFQKAHVPLPSPHRIRTPGYTWIPPSERFFFFGVRPFSLHARPHNVAVASQYITLASSSEPRKTCAVRPRSALIHLSDLPPGPAGQ